MVYLHNILDELHISSTECVLATIIHVKGSAYLCEGTSMLINKDGSYIGMISAGCLEQDVILHTHRVFESKKTETLIYRTEDLEWGVATGCNGTLYILLEYVNRNMKENLLAMRDHLNKGNVMIQQKVLSKDWNLESSHFSTEELFNKHFLDGIKTHFIYTHRMTPKPRLLIFGAGLDVPPVVRMAAQAGFSVTVCDWRAALCNEHTIPGADHYIIGFPNEIGKKLSFKKEDNVIIMTHNLQRDREILTLVKNETLFYLGILGSRKRTAHLFDAEIPHHIHSPVGIAIGAKGPYEIAISIVAELIQSRNGQRHV